MYFCPAMAFNPVVLDILKLGIPGVCFLFVAYNFRLFREAQVGHREVVKQVLDVIKHAPLGIDNFAALMEVINKAIQPKDTSMVPVRFAWATFGFVGVVFVFQLVSLLIPPPVPPPPAPPVDPVPKELLGTWYYNSLTEDSQKLHGGISWLVSEGGKTVFKGKRLYTYVKNSEGKWVGDFNPREWHSTPVTMVGDGQLLFHYIVTASDGSTTEGVCFGTITGNGEKTEIFGRILTDVTMAKGGAGLNFFVRDNRWPQNALKTTTEPTWGD
jgi:hypothetical protein